MSTRNAWAKLAAKEQAQAQAAMAASEREEMASKLNNPIGQMIAQGMKEAEKAYVQTRLEAFFTPGHVRRLFLCKIVCRPFFFHWAI